MSEESKSPSPKDLENRFSQLQSLSKHLLAALRPESKTEVDYCLTLEAAFTVAEKVDWSAFLESIREAAESARTKQLEDLNMRRQALHRAAREAGVIIDGAGNSDRIDIFQIDYEGMTAVVKLSDITIERIKLSDGGALFRAIRELRLKLENNRYSRESFFENLRVAYAALRNGGSQSDEFISVADLHREVVFEQARKSDAFRRSPDPKNLPVYPLYQFVFDLARFVHAGVAMPGGLRLKTQTPSMAEARRTIHIPDLNHPTGPATAAARLAIGLA
jgi:hypothetical protein